MTKCQNSQFSHHDGEPKITVTRLICPGDCPNDISAIALGEHDAADNYLDTYPEIFRQQGPLMAIRKATEAQATATPDYVSLPVTIWKITSRGITSDQSFDLHAR